MQKGKEQTEKIKKGIKETNQENKSLYAKEQKKNLNRLEMKSIQTLRESSIKTQ
ncbi:hypothetical protein [Helicobacter sp. MIT 14-3879]|uniref:hypothetical protein n=1 Tax=Helicobacter sp. MIT 14-3879 TaxID=2040649 RepID=UPI0015F17736|nr:hypothetical protein [Helicobacter sp. MIT 14-3879]